jgi:hypothetical protein
VLGVQQVVGGGERLVHGASTAQGVPHHAGGMDGEVAAEHEGRLGRRGPAVDDSGSEETAVQDQAGILTDLRRHRGGLPQHETEPTGGYLRAQHPTDLHAVEDLVHRWRTRCVILSSRFMSRPG